MTIAEDSGSLGLEDESGESSDKIFQNYLMPTLKLYDTRVSINHWQLRDCVKHSSIEPGKIYYIYEHSIRVLDTRSHPVGARSGGGPVAAKDRKRRSSSPRRPVQSQTHSPSQKLVELDFKSRCFQENNGLLVSGGLIGPDDQGNWNHFTRQPPTVLSGNASTRSVSNGLVKPINIGNSSILADHSAYSNRCV